jgi:hypothetical protein
LPQHQNNRESTLTKEKKQGIAATVIVHLLFAIFLVFMSFKIKPTMPVEVEEGLLVNFGFDQTGEGLFEPAPVAEASPSPPAAAEAVEDDAVLTQDFEEAPVVKKTEPTAEELKRREEAAAERKRIEQENAERIRREEEQRRLNQINDRTKMLSVMQEMSGNQEPVRVSPAVKETRVWKRGPLSLVIMVLAGASATGHHHTVLETEKYSLFPNPFMTTHLRKSLL